MLTTQDAKVWSGHVVPTPLASSWTVALMQCHLQFHLVEPHLMLYKATVLQMQVVQDLLVIAARRPEVFLELLQR